MPAPSLKDWEAEREAIGRGGDLPVPEVEPSVDPNEPPAGETPEDIANEMVAPSQGTLQTAAAIARRIPLQAAEAAAKVAPSLVRTGQAMPPQGAIAPAPRQQPLPPEMRGAMGGFYYPPDYIPNLDLEHPQAGQALDQYTRWAESPMGRAADLARTQQQGMQRVGAREAEGLLMSAAGQAAQAQEMRDYREQEDRRFQAAKDRRERMMRDYQAQMDRYQRANDAIASQRIDPERFWNSKSTGAKILATIGIGLGAAASIQSGAPNFALQRLQTDIDRDIAAQVANLNNKRAGLQGQQTLLAMMMKHYDTMEQAEEATRAHGIRAYQMKVEDIAKTTNSALTRQKAVSLAEKLGAAANESEKKLQLMAAQASAEAERQRMAAAAAAAQAQAENRKKLEQLQGWRPLDEKEAKYLIPGFGIAAPTTGESAIPKLRDDAARIMTHNQNLDRAIQIAQKGGTWSTLSPQERDEIQQLYYFVFNPEVKELSGAAVTDSEMERYKKQFGRDPSSTWDNVVSDVPRSLTRLKEQLNRGFGNRLKAYGVTGDVAIGPNPETGRWEWHVKNAPAAPQHGGATLYDSPE